MSACVFLSMRKALYIVLMATAMMLSNTAWARLIVTSAQFNWASSAMVTAGDDVRVGIEVASNDNDDRWESTTLRLSNGVSSCVNTPDDSNGNGYAQFDYQVPNASGTYDVTLIAHRNSNCFGSNRDGDRTFDSALIIVDSLRVNSIVRINDNPTSANTVRWRVTFNRNVTQVRSSDFNINRTGGLDSPDLDVSPNSGTSSATWTVTASDYGDDDENGTLRLDLDDDDHSIRDASNNSVRLSNSNDSFTGETYTIDHRGPQVVSINRAGVNPTSASSVDWTVTFNENVTGVDASDFDLISGGGLGGSRAITSVVGSGTTWMVTATTGTGNGTLRLDLDDNNSIRDEAGNTLRGDDSRNGDFRGETYTIDQNAPTECYIDDFDRPNGAPGANWSVGHESGSFGDPRIVNGRLRLTDNSVQASTYATLQRIFPGAGNKIVVEFNHYAYGGNGADGIAMVLSDASKPPIAGAFGGSLGYAPKQASAGGDTTHAGFSGGWLGVGLDEFGNFSNPTEGRSGGPGQRADAVTIRGSGSDFDGYEYLRTTGSLGTGVDTSSSNPGPGYRYRITVDHSDSVHAYTKVERDTSGSGTNYTTLISSFDAKAQPGQAAVPTNWSLSFTGSTGGNSNVHEFTHLQVCSVTLERLHHIEIDHPTTSCGAAPVTIKACANADCSSLYVGKVTVNLANVTSSGTSSWSSGNLLTFFNGQTQVTLNQGSPVNATVNIGGSTATSPPATSGTVCTDGNGNATNCVVNFSSACSFDVVEPGKALGSPIYTKLVGQQFSLDLRPSDASGNPAPYNGNVTVSLVDQDAPTGAGQCSNTNTGITPESASIAFNNESVKTVNFTVNKAQKNVRVRVIAGSGGSVLPSCSRDNFAIRPQSFQLTTPAIPDCAGATSCGSFTYAAGEPFVVAATPTPVPTGYVGTPVLDKTRVIDHKNEPVADALVGSFGVAVNGVASSSFQYNDVGSIKFLAGEVIGQDFVPGAVTDNDFTNVDQVVGVAGNVVHDSEGDCIPNRSTNTKINGKYGCLIGNDETAPKGRFRPDHYVVGAEFTPACPRALPAKSFTYMGQPLHMVLTVTAKSKNDDVLTRYKSVTSGTQFPPLATLEVLGVDDAGTDSITSDDINVTSRFNPALPTAFVWIDGRYDGSNTQQLFVRKTASGQIVPDGSYENVKLKVSVTDPDGVKITQLGVDQIAAAQQVLSKNPTIIRFGRLRLANAYGSEKLDLPIKATTEYWKNNVVGFVLNSDDSCTKIDSSSITLLNQQGGLSAANMPNNNFSVPADPLVFESGQTSLVVKKPLPTPTKKGSTDICVDLDPDLNGVSRDATCQASGAGKPWLQGAWSGPNYDDDPRGRATFGIFKNGPIIYLRELY